MAEFAIVAITLRLVLPRDWPWGIYVAIGLALVIGLTILNDTIRRRVIPR